MGFLTNRYAAGKSAPHRRSRRLSFLTKSAGIVRLRSRAAGSVELSACGEEPLAARIVCFALPAGQPTERVGQIRCRRPAVTDRHLAIRRDFHVAELEEVVASQGAGAHEIRNRSTLVIAAQCPRLDVRGAENLNGKLAAAQIACGHRPRAEQRLPQRGLLASIGRECLPVQVAAKGVKDDCQRRILGGTIGVRVRDAEAA